jgi:hypothetical protein
VCPLNPGKISVRLKLAVAQVASHPHAPKNAPPILMPTKRKCPILKWRGACSPETTVKKMGMPPREALNSELKKREIMLLSLALFTGPMALVASQGGLILPVKAGGEIGFGQSLSFSVCYTPFAEHFPMINTSGLNYWQGSSINTLAAWSFGDRAMSGFRLELGSRYEAGSQTVSNSKRDGESFSTIDNSRDESRSVLVGLAGLGYNQVTKPTTLFNSTVGPFSYIYGAHGGAFLGNTLSNSSYVYAEITLGILTNFD